jgi:adenosine 3'-phospho 5'-phosphosulfate transporter B2
MDFQTLAESTSIRSIRRRLYEASLTEDDDFSHLDTSHTSHHDHVYDGGSDSIIEMTTSQSMARSNANANEPIGTSPMLSATAEAELLMLSTNFLLYVAMILIITMVAKIYFPESLQRSSPEAPRNSVYRRVDQNEKSDTYYSSDDENDKDEDLKDLLEIEDDGRNIQSVDSNTSSLVELEFEQENTSKADVMKRLFFCVVMLNVTFVTWGLLQERMLTRRYPRITGEFFTYSYALVFTNRFWTTIMSGMLMMYLKPKRSASTVIYEYSFPSISNMLSSWCQYESLRYVSFPAVTLFKSFKLAPTMAMGKFLGNKQYPIYDYYVAFIIGIGVTMFMTSSDDLKVGFGYNIYDQEDNAVWTGIMLLGVFLFFDSFTSQWQSRMFQRHKDLSMVELMFATSAFSSLLSMITLIHSQELWPALDFVYRHSEIHVHFFLFSICSTIGQLLIFYTIKNFGAVVFTLIMTTRILLSIACSCYIYDHEVTSTGFFGLMLVFGAILYRIKKKAEMGQLVKWQGMEDSQAHELVQEWHEHVDM